MQTLDGSREHLAAVGPRVIRDFMPDAHRAFFAQLPFLVLGGLDQRLQPWATMLAAPPGFAHAPDATHLRIDTLPPAGDPLATRLAPGVPLGLLGIEPHTRRRNRVNGTVEARDDHGFTIKVQQSFGNCPKYIQAREPVFAQRPGRMPAAQWLDGLDPAAQRLIGGADTFFIASAHPARLAGDDDADPGAHGVDVSHRGGRPGFVRVDEGDVLTVPDFPGNSFFNTLGNLAVHPHAGLLFIDHGTGESLHVAARVQVVSEGTELTSFPGARRLLRLHVEGALRRPATLSLRWGEASLSPHLAGTGRWPNGADSRGGTGLRG